MNSTEITEINGEITECDSIVTIAIVVGGGSYEPIADSNGEFEIELPDELFAQQLSTQDLLLLSMVLLLLFGYSSYKIINFIIHFSTHYGFYASSI